MRTFISFILIGAIMVHATLGCCFHHAHANEIGCHEIHAEEDSHDCPHGSQAINAGWVQAIALEDCADAHQLPDQHEHSGCEDGKCSFARIESSPSADASSWDSVVGPTALDQLAVESTQITTCPDRVGYSMGDVASGELRYHLVLAVLLI